MPMVMSSSMLRINRKGLTDAANSLERRCGGNYYYIPKYTWYFGCRVPQWMARQGRANGMLPIRVGPANSSGGKSPEGRAFPGENYFLPELVLIVVPRRDGHDGEEHGHGDDSGADQSVQICSELHPKRASFV